MRFIHTTSSLFTATCTHWLPRSVASVGIVAAAVALSACSSNTPQHPLQYAPANSLWVAANLEPLPEPARQFQNTVTAPLKALWAQWYPLLKNDLAQKDSAKAQRGQQFLSYLEQSLAQPGLSGFGIAPDALYALYEVELHPVLRINVADPAKLRQLITEIETIDGRPFESQQLEGLTVWRFPLSNIKPKELVDQVGKITQQDLQELQDLASTGNTATAPHLLLALSDKDAVLTFERPTETTLRPQLLGLEKPKNNMWEAKTLQKVNERHGLSPYGTLWLETARLLELAGIAPENASAEVQAQAKQRSIIRTSLSGACVRELTQLGAKAPELVVGITQMNETQFKAKMTLALDAELREDLRQLQAPLQGWQAQPGLMEMGMSLRIDKLAGLLQKTINAVNAKPFECEPLHALNEIARNPKAIQTLAPLYAMGGTATGLYMRLTSMEMRGETPIPQGVMLANSANPRALLAYVAMATPGLAQLNIQPGMPPQAIEIPSPEWQELGIPTAVALSDKAIGLSAGASGAAELQSLLAQAETEPAPFMFSRYSGAFFADALEPIAATAYEQYEAKAKQAQVELQDNGAEPQTDSERQQQAQIREHARQAMRTAWDWVRLFKTVGDATTVGTQGLEYQFSIELQKPKS